MREITQDNPQDHDQHLIACRLIFHHLNTELNLEKAKHLGEKTRRIFTLLKVVNQGNNFERIKWSKPDGRNGSVLRIQVYNNPDVRYKLALWDVSDENLAILQENLLLEVWRLDLLQNNSGIELQTGTLFFPSLHNCFFNEKNIITIFI